MKYEARRAATSTSSDSGISTGFDSGQTLDAQATPDAVGDVAGDAVGDVVGDAVAIVIGACSDLPGVGTWQNITPPTLDIAEWCALYNGTCPSPATSANGQIGTATGPTLFVLDPSHPGTVYLGTSSLGIWKSTDCGSTWVHINTGQNGAVLDAGRNWTMVVVPTNSQRGFRSTLEDRARGRGHRRMTGASTRVCIEKPVGRHTSPFPPRERIVLACVVSTAWTSPPAAHGAHACARVHAAIGLRA